MDWEWPGFFAVAIGGAVGVRLLVGWLQLPPHATRILWLAFLARVIGSLARHQVLESAYMGVGDASGYYKRGAAYAEMIWALDFSFFADPWFGGTLWGTQFMRYLSAFAVAITGPTMRGEFLLFALASMLGLWLIVAAVRRDSEEDAWRYAPWVSLLPSLCFWPCSVGKEAVMLLALGLATYGYAGRRDRVSLLPLCAGGALAFAIRPYAAGLIALACLGAELVQSTWTPRKLLMSVILAPLALFVVIEAASEHSLDLFEAEDVEQFVGATATMTSRGGSQIEAVDGVLAGPMGLVNVLFRPFLWEASGALALLCALELTVLWSLVWMRRGLVVAALRSWRINRALRFGLLVGLLFALAYGLTFFNLGIIARQRSLVWPFLLMLVGVSASGSILPGATARVGGAEGRGTQVSQSGAQFRSLRKNSSSHRVGDVEGWEDQLLAIRCIICDRTPRAAAP